MSDDHRQFPGPVTADDLALGVRLAVALLRQAAGEAAAWSVPAGPLSWDCWETVEHLADDLFAYAAQLGPQTPPASDFVPFVLMRPGEGKPRSTIFAQQEAGVDGLLLVLEACGAMLVAMVRTAAPEARAFHGFGTSDAEGSAAMGLVETLVHLDDVAKGLGLDWTPPAGLCQRSLHRLFPDAPRDTDPWATLLWATGRGELPGRERVGRWRWYSAPRGDSRAAVDTLG